jgi:hypothetical protein
MRYLVFHVNALPLLLAFLSGSSGWCQDKNVNADVKVKVLFVSGPQKECKDTEEPATSGEVKFFAINTTHWGLKFPGQLTDEFGDFIIRQLMYATDVFVLQFQNEKDKDYKLADPNTPSISFRADPGHNFKRVCLLREKTAVPSTAPASRGHGEETGMGGGEDDRGSVPRGGTPSFFRLSLFDTPQARTSAAGGQEGSRKQDDAQLDPKAADTTPETAGVVEPDLDAPALAEHFGSELIRALPLGTRRSVDSLALLLPGVLPPAQTTGPDGPRISAALGSAGQFSSNGIRGTDNNFLVDGTDNNDENVGARRQGYLVPGPQSVETVASFALNTALYDSRYGKAPGAQVDAASKAGGSVLHSTVYGLLTDQRFNAQNYFDGPVPSGPQTLTVGDRPVLIDGSPAMTDAIGPARLPDTEVTAGGVLSGAVPGLTDTFFASSFEFDRVRKIQRLNFAVPTIAERGYMGTGAVGLPTVYQGVSTYPSTTIGDAFFSLYPFPNNPTGPYGPNTYTRDRPAIGDGWQASQRIDRLLHFAGTSFLGLRYNYANEDSQIPVTGAALDSGLQVQAQIQSLTGFLSSTPSPSLANTVRFSWGTARFRFLGDRGPSLVPSGLFPTDPCLLNTRLLANTTLRSSGPVTYLRQDLGNTESVIGPIGQVNVAGYSSVGADPSSFPQRRADSTLQLADTASTTYGRHTLTAGVEAWLILLNSNVNQNARPTVSFDGEPPVKSFVPGSMFSPGVLIDAASLVAVGLDANVYQTFTTTPDTSLQLRRPQVDMFLQDDIHLHRSLNLTFGFRFSINGAPASSDGRFEATYGPNGSFLADLNSALQACIVTYLPAFCSGVDANLRRAFPPGFDQVYHAAPFGYDPRVGLAWDPLGYGKTAIRVGWGRYSGQLPAEIISDSSGLFPQSLPLRYVSLSQTSFTNLAFANSVVPTRSRSINVLPQGTNAVSLLESFSPLSTVNAFSNPLSTALIVPVEPGAGLKNPTADEFGLAIDQSLAAGAALSLAYVGGFGEYLPRANAPDATAPTMLNFIDGIAGNTGIQCGTVLQGQCPYFALRQSVHHNVADPTVYSSGATSSYQSLQLHLRVRHSWLQASSAFTWSHSLDDASDLFDTSGSFALPQDPTNLSAERASSNFDTRFRSASYFLADSRAKDPLLKGWQLSGILTLQTGQPFTVNTAYDLNLDGTDTVRLNTAAGLLGPGVGTNVPGLGRQTRIVLPASSLTGTPYQGAQFLCQNYPCDGAVGRNTFRAAGLETVDLAVSRTFALKGLPDGHKIQLRVEGFNVLNRTNFAIPVRILEEPGFGTSVSTIGTNRRLRLMIRYSF